ncbi:MAG: glucose 1-dehydrogenase [Synergistaceae bacterium]|jgi:meso-butanediol dehydrogenase/(S,S)-butanediol dehydrogenase/diacetyl reductase|nr:glucose 1-dehydrogenase [Synergistaceae bacterium]
MGDLRLKDQVIIVTGSGRGIGRAIALRAAREGAKVVVNSVTPRRTCEAVAKEITDAGGEAAAVIGDVSKESDVRAIVSKAVEQYGRLDVMIANAGVSWAKLAVETTAEEWDGIFRINALGVFLCDKIAAEQMIKQKKGKIINAASIAAHDGFRGLGAYCASKFAVHGFTQSLAKELAPYNITVNAYCPGIVDTDMWDDIHVGMGPLLGLKPDGPKKSIDVFAAGVPLGRKETPEDTAALATFLASPDADYITGQSIITGGGITMV